MASTMPLRPLRRRYDTPVLTFPVSSEVKAANTGSDKGTNRRSFSRRLLALLARVQARHELRRALRNELLFADETVLEDAGWTRAALREEIAKPFWRP